MRHMLLKRQKEVVRDLQRRRGVSADLRTYATHALTYAGTCYWRTRYWLMLPNVSIRQHALKYAGTFLLAYWLTGY